MFEKIKLMKIIKPQASRWKSSIILISWKASNNSPLRRELRKWMHMTPPRSKQIMWPWAFYPLTWYFLFPIIGNLDINGKSRNCFLVMYDFRLWWRHLAIFPKGKRKLNFSHIQHLRLPPPTRGRYGAGLGCFREVWCERISGLPEALPKG